MVKLVYVVCRRADVSPEEFRKYWLEHHGPLVRSFAKNARARRYVQSHTVDTPINGLLAQSRGMGDPYDGITEIWWDSLEELTVTLNSPEGRTANQTLIEDEGKFVDLARSFIFLTEEHTIFEF
ncbi:MAG TPA: EthD domain-containing protein [Candidatus Acidoferrales bacterium]|nr:EthD domain-containing protein [Candidatus Acidoferrales bacterium]